MPVRPKSRYSIQKSFCVLPVSVCERLLIVFRMTPCLLHRSGKGAMETRTEFGLVKRANHPPWRNQLVDTLTVFSGDGNL